MKKVLLVTDGACKKNPGPGGWAAILRYDGRDKTVVGGEPATTNNRMELLAVIKGLEALKEPVEVTVITDSKYVMNPFTEHWINKWQANGWMTNSGPVKNKDLWEMLLPLVQKHTVTWQWVKGHSGHPDNERVDALAQEQASAYALKGAV